MFCSMKPGAGGCVYSPSCMINYINTFFLFAGLAAAAAVAVMCGVCLVVWMAGGKLGTRK